ncbi:phosphonopyruvate decarboxylase [Pseudoalteromonas citrea]|uniref:Phosphonopyruvate decarboxylase n=1 Tax=Pseudoalteromonas citrea TaxID=43655 RepID=A0A5S3XVV5_9GAMM|nr:phosphonopyruvate decarboxylase [Pseudoalteromonas citrea]TMP43496.1 phosphonopyruvate decarboxylase [Pseudoalteromonas citrea]TMP62105.1 phosphonopyruvate decarboxylase [Pseudoalteromonas citrea]
MIAVSQFCQLLKSNGIDFFAGVPDSLLSPFSQYLESSASGKQHVITANEGNAVALALGHHLGTASTPLVYMQNSGLGNAYNPLVSLADPEVYSIPMVLLIGWRGQPGVKDEPQHKKQGAITLATLKAMDIPYLHLDGNTENIPDFVDKLIKKAKTDSRPVAIVVSKNTFINDAVKTHLPEPKTSLFTREIAIEQIVQSLPENAKIVCTTGMASRELFELREQQSQPHNNDFLTVGGMGHASQIALGVAMYDNKDIVCIDGDGAALMHMGSLAINGHSQLTNFKHIVLNNGCHDSVGGQATLGKQIDLTQVAKACGYFFSVRVTNQSELNDALPKLFACSQPAFLEVVIDKGHRRSLGRPTETPLQCKLAFMKSGQIDE